MVVPLQIGVWEAAKSTDSIVERPGVGKEGLLRMSPQFRSGSSTGHKLDEFFGDQAGQAGPISRRH